ncbi:hypothetical protein [Nocardia panacis]|uniref:hypothetical protein n=1 Tax=Nocardia panacis TaxID=2340916 RepID=UPI0011C3EB1A|nr:hypothetical protein [Nocardia panacis]
MVEGLLLASLSGHGNQRGQRLQLDRTTIGHFRRQRTAEGHRFGSLLTIRASGPEFDVHADGMNVTANAFDQVRDDADAIGIEVAPGGERDTIEPGQQRDQSIAGISERFIDAARDELELKPIPVKYLVPARQVPALAPEQIPRRPIAHPDPSVPDGG